MCAGPTKLLCPSLPLGDILQAENGVHTSGPLRVVGAGQVLCCRRPVGPTLLLFRSTILELVLPLSLRTIRVRY